MSEACRKILYDTGIAGYHFGAAMVDASELGAFLRSRRARLRPEEMNLPSLRRRRTAGLRREEVAQLAGISTEWYVKLEQGRAVTPSEATLAALASALRLSNADEAHLRRLASGVRPSCFEREIVPDSIQGLVESLPQPAYITGQRWDMLAWNEATSDLFGNFGKVSSEDQNILLFMLTNSDARHLFGNAWAEEARRMVAVFRATFDLWSGDPAFEDLVKRLRLGCPEFAGWWQSHDVGVPSSGMKRLNHPSDGSVDYTYATFQANDDPRLKLAIYLRHGSELGSIIK